MPFKSFGVLCTCFMSFLVFSQSEEPQIQPKKWFINVGLGGQYLTQLNNFNAALDSQNIAPIKPIFPAVHTGVGWSSEQTVIGVDIGVNFGGNGSDLSDFSISTTALSATLYYSYRWKFKEHFLLEPSFKFGGSIMQITAQSSDTLLNENEFYSGFTNMYFDQSTPLLYLAPELLTGFLMGEKEQSMIYFKMNYQLSLTEYNWKHANLPLRKSDGLILNLGYRYWF